jgi:hypothetical protein
MNKSVLFVASLLIVAACVAKESHLSKIMSKLNLIQQDLEEHGAGEEIAIKFNQLQNHYADTQTAWDAFHAEQQSRASAGKTLISDFIAKLNEDYNKIVGAINHFQSFAMTHGESAHSTSEKIEEEKKEAEALEAEIKQALQDYRDHGIEAEQKLTLIKFLIDIITDELLTGEGGASFVQLRTFNDKMKELKGMLEKSKDSKFAPLVSTLLSLAEQKGFSDQNLLNQIINTLRKLEENINAFRKSQQDGDLAHIEELKSLLSHKHESINHLTHVMEDTLSQLRNAQNRASKLEHDRQVLESEIHRKENEGAYWDDVSAYQEQLRVAREAQRQEEAALVNRLQEAQK